LKNGVDRNARAVAMRVLDAATEFSMLDNLASVPPRLPLMPALLGKSVDVQSRVNGDGDSDGCGRGFIAVALKRAQLDELSAALIAQHTLNDDQQRVLQTVSSWFVASDEQSGGGGGGGAAVDDRRRVLLLHGVFGSGKSTLLAVCVIFVARVAELSDDSSDALRLRVLLAAATNVAVDRVLTQLLARDFTNFTRVIANDANFGP
jgi:hypothetical protein